MNNSRGYTWLNVRSIDEQKRIIEGVATTPVQARDGDILEVEGISFKLPIPFMYRHREPLGNVTNAKVTKDGITVRVQVGAAGISQSVDEYWNLISSGLVRGLSIAWRTIAEMWDQELGGYRIMKSEWLELSAVPVPADPNATITSIRSADEEDLLAVGIRAGASFSNLPVAARDVAWDGVAARSNVAKWASSDGSGAKEKIDWAKYRKAFFWFEPKTADSFGSYELPFADVVNGELMAIPRGIEAASTLSGINISDPERESLQNHVTRYFSKMASQFNDAKIVAPWNKTAPALASEKRGVKTKPGAPGKPTKQRDKSTMKNFDTQIAEFETELKDVREQMTALMENSEDGILTGENATTYDTLTERSTTLRNNVKRLQAHKENSEGGEPTPPAPSPARERGPVVLPTRAEVRAAEKDPDKKGIGVARMVIALIQARGNHYQAADLAKQHYKDMPEVGMALRAAVDAGDTTTSGWASQLIPAAQQMQNEFIDLLRPATLVGRIPGLRRVPFNVAVPLQSGGGAYGWVGEAKPKPVTSLAFASATLRWAKAAGIVVITRELARFGQPSAELIIRNELVKGTAQFLDGQFIDHTVTASNDNPASILNGVSAQVASGTTAEAFRYDLSVIVGLFITANQDPTTAVLLMSATTAMNLALMRNALGQREFPGISVKGGDIDGLPVVVSQTVGARLVLINANDILLADDGVINVDVSEQASIEMSTTPLHGEESPVDGTVFKSLWQNNLVGLRVETFMTWKRSRASSVAWLNNVAYAPSQPGSPA